MSTEGIVVPAGVPESFDEHVKLHFDLQVLAFKADITRVSTVLYARDLTGRRYPESETNSELPRRLPTTPRIRTRSRSIPRSISTT